MEHEKILKTASKKLSRKEIKLEATKLTKNGPKSVKPTKINTYLKTFQDIDPLSLE